MRRHTRDHTACDCCVCRPARGPRVVPTAARPAQLRDSGAWQAIDQIKIYGPYVRWFVEVPTPTTDALMLRYVRSVASRAVAMARGRPARPGVLNAPFRGPPGPQGAT